MKDAGSAYNALIEKQRRWIYGLPESEFLLPLMKLRMTEEEARFLLNIPHMPHTAEQLSMTMNMELRSLEDLLDLMAGRGLVMKIAGSRGLKYMLHDPFFWFYRMPGYKGEDDDFNRKISPLLNRYYTNAMAHVAHAHTHKGLRTIPVNRTVQDTQHILPFENVTALIENSRAACVTTCACRHRKNLDPDEENCRHDTRTCLHFDHLAKYLVQNGIGEDITKEEALEITERSADAGLVHAVSNSVEGVDTICNCCSCCCAFIDRKLALPPPLKRGHQSSNYIVRLDSEKCRTCGLCTTRCPMNALTVRKEDTGIKKIIFAEENCIGCGVCARKCPSGALRLIRKEKDEVYPDTPLSLAMSMLKDQETR